MERARKTGILLVLFALGAATSFAIAQETTDPLNVQTAVTYLELPDGFQAQVYADQSMLSGYSGIIEGGGAGPGSRFMAFRNGVLYVAVPNGRPYQATSGHVVALPDEDGDGQADEAVTVVSGLDRPNSVAFHGDYMYVGVPGEVRRYQMDGMNTVDGSEETVVSFEHGVFSTTVKTHNGKLWVATGTWKVYNGNKNDQGVTWGVQKLADRNQFTGALNRCDLDGSNCQQFVTGLRNTLGYDFGPDGTVVGADMGGGHYNPDFPPDELNVLEDGNDYGWPKCQAENRLIEGNNPDRRTPTNSPECSGMTPPAKLIESHSSPLGVAFYTGDQFPDEYRGDLFVAFHGSWDTQPPSGYKIVRYDWDGDRSQTDFATGWLQGSNTEDAKGRPTDIVIGPDGAMYVSDDAKGRIYRIAHGDTASTTDDGSTGDSASNTAPSSGEDGPC